MNQKNKEPKVWFITGTSNGFGFYLTKLLLKIGDKVFATSRTPEKIMNASAGNENLLAVKVDLTSAEAVTNAVEKAIHHFGKIDVIVNNAGYVLLGSIEELTDKEFRATVDVNIFGTINVLRAALPYLRRQKHGNIINISSNAGYVGMANVSSYNVSKFAIIGLSEALQLETKPFGIKVTVIAPGQFRTNLWGSDAIKLPGEIIPEYNTSALASALSEGNGKQVGNPEKLVKIIVDIANMENPPLHLMLGKDTYDMVIKHREKELVEFNDWKAITFSTDFD